MHWSDHINKAGACDSIGRDFNRTIRVLFTSIEYLIFLPLVVGLYWGLPQRFRLPMLLIASYAFYMSWIPAFGALIFALTIFNWLWGKLLAKQTDKRKLVMGLGVAVNLATLGLFKYANFLTHTAHSVLKPLFKAAPDWTLNIILPLGISFFVFEFIHYLYEVYRGNKPIDSFVMFALFAAFFPTQIAGPIKRYPDFQQQMSTVNQLKLQYFDEGLPLIIVGLAKKLLLADNLAVLVQMGFSGPHPYTGLELWAFAYAFAFQIYFDFSGYTDIARGSAMLFGYHIPINFNMPYIASNISDFWRRWHISLSTWLRDYLFIPLGGSRGTNLFTCRNLLITMALGGLWHGAAWNFVVWGIFHGLCLIGHRQFVALKEALPSVKRAVDSLPGHWLSMLLTFNTVCIGWVFFRMQNLKDAFAMIKRMFSPAQFFSVNGYHQLVMMRQELPVIVPMVLLMVAALLLLNLPLSACTERGYFKKMPAMVKAAYCCALVVAITIFTPDTSAPFIYFQF